jgi:7,8-dihydropterin-6-yl-methyl-4-(beta-D-ribofuranosyl)aminobenzene 5'-phosphate synthase
MNLCLKQFLPATAGLHLAPRDCVPRIEPTVRDLKALAPDMLVLPGHCTGWRAQQALELAFPDTCMPPSVGGTYDIKPPT